MTTPRTTSSEADELAATIAGLKSRVNELETATGFGTVPVGTIVDYIGALAPSGWTLLDGTTITNGRLLYPNLWLIIPSSFKSGDNIIKPDTRGKVTVHQGGTAFTGNIGSTGGAETVTLSTSQIPSHTHGFFGYRSNQEANGYGLTITGGFVDRVYVYQSTSQTNIVDYEGGGQPHDNIQPFMVVVKMMKLN